jgi:hypothetical protein
MLDTMIDFLRSVSLSFLLVFILFYCSVPIMPLAMPVTLICCVCFVLGCKITALSSNVWFRPRLLDYHCSACVKTNPIIVDDKSSLSNLSSLLSPSCRVFLLRRHCLSLRADFSFRGLKLRSLSLSLSLSLGLLFSACLLTTFPSH